MVKAVRQRHRERYYASRLWLHRCMTVCRSDKRGGGVGILQKKSYKLKKAPVKRFATLEHVDVTLTQTSQSLRAIVSYRPLTS